MNKISNRVKAFFSKPANVILVIFALLLVLLTLYPLCELVRHTFIVHATDATVLPGLKKGELTTASWKKLLTTSTHKYSWINFYKPMVNCVVLAALSA